MLTERINTITIMLVAGVLLSAVSSVMAQRQPNTDRRGPSAERAERHLAMLKERLNLTDIQAEKIKGIMEESRKEAETQRDKHMGNPEAAAKFREEHRRATEGKIKAVLNDDQKKEYDKIKDNSRQNRQERKRDRDLERMGPGGQERGSGEVPGPGGRRGGR